MYVEGFGSVVKVESDVGFSLLVRSHFSSGCAKFTCPTELESPFHCFCAAVFSHILQQPLFKPSFNTVLTVQVFGISKTSNFISSFSSEELIWEGVGTQKERFGIDRNWKLSSLKNVSSWENRNQVIGCTLWFLFPCPFI